MKFQPPGALEPELDEVPDSGENGFRGVSGADFCNSPFEDSKCIIEHVYLIIGILD